MINTVVLTGRLTKDVDLRYTQSGTAVGSFNLAVERRFKDEQGNREADFVNCVIWRKAAENLSNFVHKGSLLGVEGRLQTRNYENKQGQRVYITEVVIENFTLLEPRSAQQGNNQNNGYNNNQNNNQSNGYNNNNNQIDVSDNDLPF